MSTLFKIGASLAFVGIPAVVAGVGLSAAGFERAKTLGNAGCLILIAALLVISTAALIALWKNKL